MATTILTKDAVTLYDIETNQIWDQTSHAHAEADLHSARKDGNLVQEHETTDRDGNPLRIALVIENRKYGDPDMGGVYEFPLPA
jgi:hypothetical protein